jgi:hypothetical protein
MNEDKRTNNDLQNTTQKKLKIEQHGPSEKREGTQVLWKGETVVKPKTMKLICVASPLSTQH